MDGSSTRDMVRMISMISIQVISDLILKGEVVELHETSHIKVHLLGPDNLSHNILHGHHHENNALQHCHHHQWTT